MAVSISETVKLSKAGISVEPAAWQPEQDEAPAGGRSADKALPFIATASARAGANGLD